MPSRNVIKQRLSESYYHVYARGNNKQKIFLDDNDYRYFIKLIERYLSKEQQVSKANVVYPNFAEHIEVIAYCQMINHFHILIYQHQVPYLEKFMRSIMTSYSKFFNFKYERTGPVFESRYKAVWIDQDNYLQHITRYIHLNPGEWKTYEHSSLSYYRDGGEPYWLQASRILENFDSREDYLSFVADYEGQRDILADIKHQLADM